MILATDGREFDDVDGDIEKLVVVDAVQDAVDVKKRGARVSFRPSSPFSLSITFAS